MRWLYLLLAACGFQHGESSFHSGDAPSAPPADSAHRDSAITMPDGMADAKPPPPPPPCQVSDASLVWCLEFDEPGLAAATTTLDGSGLHLDPTISGLGVVTRNVPAASQAVQLSTSSSITITKPTDFNLQHFTLSAWVYRTTLAELGVVDTSKQFTMSINQFNATVECAVSDTNQNTVGFSGASPTAVNEWDLIACTYDGAQVCTYSFRNGSALTQSGCAPYNRTLSTAGTASTVGEWANGASHLVGELDQVRVYNRALTRKEICVNGGLSGCQ